MKTAPVSSGRPIGIFAIIALLLVAITVIVINIDYTEPAPEPILANANSLYLAAVEAEQLPVATVNNQVIEADALNKLYLTRIGSTSSRITIKDVKKALRLKRQIAGKLIIETLIEQAAAKHNVTVDEEEIDASMNALKKTFPSPEKYLLHIAQIPDGEHYLRNVARANILKEKLVDVVGVEPDYKTVKTAKANNKNSGAEAFIRNARLIQQLKAEAEISNMLEQRHAVMLRQTQLMGFAREKIKVASN